MNSLNFRLALIGLAAGVIIALALVPQTRLLFKMQALPPSGAASTLAGCPPNRTAFVQSHPNDYQIQLAAPFDTQTQTQVQFARILVPRFPDSASLRANILRYATLHDIHLVRDEDYLLEGQPVPKLKPWERTVEANVPAQLAAFDADAAAGERLDPHNAYFPFMRAAGLFAGHRDAEGLAAVQRASQKTQWREYMADEVEGHLRINNAVNGGQEAVSALAVAASLLLPQYSRLRAVARIVTYKAVLLEQAGHPRQGLVLRRELSRSGYLMTSQSTMLIGNLVGTAISQVSRIRPGGIPFPKSGLDAVNDKQTREQIFQRRMDMYLAYVRRLGQEDAAREAQAQFAGEHEVRQIPFTDFTFGLRTTDYIRLGFSLAFGWVLVTNLLMLALLGLAAWGLSRLPHVREGRPLPAGARAGVWVGLIFGLAALVLFYNTRLEDMGSLILLLLVTLLPLAALPIFAVLRPSFRKPLLRGILAGAGTLAFGWALGALAAWKIHPAYDTSWLLASFDIGAGQMDSADSRNPSLPMQTLQGAVAGLAVPILLALALAGAARIRRVPVSVGLVQGFRDAALPMFCGLIFLYGGLLLWTARQESAANYALSRSLQGDGQYLAELTGQTWPGPVR